MREERTATSPRARWLALVLFATAVATAIAGHLFLPTLLVWLLFVMLLWAAGTTWFRTIDRTRGSGVRFGATAEPHDSPGPLRRGEVYDRAVKLTFAPNVPMAEAMCSRLRANGIEAFYKRPQFGALPALATNDFAPVEVWVDEHHLEQARAVLGPGALAAGGPW